MKLIQVFNNINFFLKYAKRFALFSVLLIAALGALSAFSLHKLRMEYSMKQFLPQSHPLLLKDDQNKDRFLLSSFEPFFVVLTLPATEGSWLEENRVAQLRAVSDEIARWEGVEYVYSVATIEGASSSSEGLTVGKITELTPKELWKERFLKDPILSPQIISQDARTTVLAIGQVPGILMEKSQGIQNKALDLAKKELVGANAELGGIPAIQGEMGKLLGKELVNFILLSLLASLVTLLLFFRTISSVFITLFLIVLANILSLAWMVWVDVSFTVLSSTLPILVALTVLSMSAHTMLRYASDWKTAKEKQENPNPIRVLFRSYAGLMLPNFLTSLTTTIGFFAIAFTEVPLIRQYGLSIGFSIFVCWLVVIVALLPLLILLPVPEARDWLHGQARWALYIQKNKHWVLGACAVVIVSLSLFSFDLNWGSKLFDDLPKSHSARQTTEYLDEKLGGMIPLDLIVEKDEVNAWNDPASIAQLEKVANKWRSNPNIGSIITLADFQLAAAKVQGRGLASTRQEAAEVGFLYTFSEEDPYKKFVTADGRATRLSLRLHDIPADLMQEEVNNLTKELQSEFSDWKVYPAGMATTAHQLNNELSSELISGFWQALLLISVLLLVVFRSLKWTLLAVIPNLVPVVFLLGTLGAFGTSIKPGIALIFSIALGISFDNTVYLLGRLRLLQERSLHGRVNPIKAWYQEGNLCFYSSLSVSAGFLVFLASYFSLNQQFGLYMLVAIFGSLVGDLVLLPTILAFMPNLLRDKKKIAPKEKVMSENAVAASVALLFTIGTFVPNTVSAASAVAAPKSPSADAKTILEKVEKNVSSNDEIATLKMLITEKDGTEKERAIEIKRKGADDKQKVLVRMNSPADLKGTALLSVSKGSESDQWLYLPSSKQTRRILSSKRSSSFMDSELSFEDMGTSSDAKYKSTVLKEETMAGRKFHVIESVPTGESSYGKIHIWVDAEKNLVGKMEYFDKKMKPLKVSNFSGYKQFDKGVWRAQKVQVENLQTKRGTVLELSNLQINKGLDDDEFTESALTDSD
ncbi:MAG: outer membrane lipoprotein-sorting protein [Oligoflexia bacterium]|nr:outer membrane lipoprotein-sorting protein [Oligoflexia bacterium]